ncbi:hypothetical protein N7470_007340 [Penicillium chermesinum]|nr:hypothetical protein N7470_007340 [Penicillium chermesinum]
MHASREDFDSLPPAVRRKDGQCSTLNFGTLTLWSQLYCNAALHYPHIPFIVDESPPRCTGSNFFSNVERLRMRLGQEGQGDLRAPRPNARSSPRAVRASRGLDKRSSSPKKLRKPGSLQLAYLIAQADSQCFHSLPAKIQQKHFSPEERRRFLSSYRESVILDAADAAFYRRDKARQRQLSTDSLPSDDTLPVTQTASVFWDSDSDSDSEQSPRQPSSKMDRTFFDNFRWLDEDGDLDLSLDEYHAHVADAAIPAAKPRRRPSIRRPLSLSTQGLRHRPVASIPRSLASSQSVPVSSLSRQSYSRPTSRQQPHHHPKSSTSSIDPSAQYYQDPDARLKLRVYLASPQKFDEAIEFGFPSLDQDKENFAPVVHSPLSFDSAGTFSGTFFEEDDGTVVGSPGTSLAEEPVAPRMSTQVRETPRPSTDSRRVHKPGKTTPKFSQGIVK